jgi:hypothetical protein
MNQQSLHKDKVDRELDAALANYAAIEPRPGLEERILTTLRAGQKPAVQHSWWNWPALGVTASVLIVLAISLAWKSGKQAQNITEHQSATPARGNKETGTRMATNSARSPAHPAVLDRPASHRIREGHAIIGSGPKLAQFPSLRPLSEQEQLLVRFVREFPEEAALIARVQAESEKETEELGGDQSPETNPDQQDQPQER